MFKRMLSGSLAAVAVSAVMLAGALPVSAKPPADAGRKDPSQIVSDAGASNLGVCSSFLGRRQLRDDVNRIINSGAIPGIENPGQLYKIRAKERPQGATPQQECLPRQLDGTIPPATG